MVAGGEMRNERNHRNRLGPTTCSPGRGERKGPCHRSRAPAGAAGVLGDVILWFRSQTRSTTGYHRSSLRDMGGSVHRVPDRLCRQGLLQGTNDWAGSHPEYCPHHPHRRSIGSRRDNKTCSRWCSEIRAEPPETTQQNIQSPAGAKGRPVPSFSRPCRGGGGIW